MHFQSISDQGSKLAGVVVLATDKTSAGHLQAGCEAHGMPVTLAAQLGDTHSSHAAALQGAAVVIVDVGRAATALTLVRELRDLCSPNTVLLLIADDADLALARELRRQGVSEIYSRPFDHDELYQMASEALGSGVDHRARRGSRIIAVHGICGGVGAGVVSAGLATVIAVAHGRRTVLLDLDLSSPRAGSWLGCDKPSELSALLKAPERIDAALVEQVMQRPMAQLALLDGVQSLSSHDPRCGVGCQRLANVLAGQYRYQIWRSSGMDTGAQHSLLQADISLLVCDGSLPALRGVRDLLPQLAESRPGMQTLLVFNQRSPDEVLNAESFAESLGRQPDLVLPYRSKLARQQLDGVPFNAAHHVLNKEFSALAARLLGLPVKQQTWWRRWA